MAEERTLTVDRDAEEELAAAASWYDERRPGLGEEFFIAVDETFRLIRQFPEIGKRTQKSRRRSASARSPLRASRTG